MPRALPLDPDVRRAQLLAAARVVFAREGYHATSVADLIKEAGVARGTFYNYFESKRAAFQAVLDDLMSRLNAAVSPVHPKGDIPAQLRLNLEMLVGVLSEEEDVTRLLFADAVGLDEEGDAALRTFYGQGTERLARALRTGQNLGMIRAGDTDIMARCLLGMLKEPIFQAWLYNKPYDPVAVVDELLLMVLSGVWA